jgi:SAM-dependent methyltransferase
MTAAGTNAAQAEHWNGVEGQHWATQHDRYEAMNGPFGDRLLGAAAIQPGDRVLDVGCGPGGFTLAVARATGPDGSVVGIDLSVPMLERARQRTRDAGAQNVGFVTGDAQTHVFDEAAFDMAVSRFGVMFFDDVEAAFANMARAVRPSGRLGFVCWQDAAVNEWMLVPSTAALAHVPGPDPTVFETLNPFELADPDRLTAILEGAGFAEIDCQGLVQPLLFGGASTVEEAVKFFRDSSFGAVLLADASPDAVERALAAVADVFVAHLTDEGVQLAAAAWLVTATKSGSCPF